MGRKKQWMGVVMKIQVTQEDIDAGKQKDIHCCPLALAIKRVTGKEIQVVTDYFDLVNENGLFEIYDLPEIAANFRRDFDHCLTVEPFEFELDI